ncbi:unnamed protein product [Clonostachys byssicola]|uniref:NADP-dependent oxidoreductase domain-containing protein n=1 Tax=Clonostachys byssicola TaxID=160290 RepID=A0A9N9UMM4_9HYPO|nr:unnamed protein product [Clonostachys byssicola]
MASKTPVTFLLGTHHVGDSTKSPLAPFDRKEDVQALLDAFYSRGYTHLDTGRNYSLHAPGSSEDRLGKSDNLGRFVIHTKVEDGFPGAHEAAKIHASIDKSLKALKVSSVETMYLHVPDRQTPFAETAQAFHEAKQQGKFKHWGLSNYAAGEVEQFIKICEEKGYDKPEAFQGHYNPIVRGGEKELFPVLRKHGIPFIAYSPAAGGFFNGNVATSTRWDSENATGNLYNALYKDAAVRASAAIVHDASARHGISGHAAAIRWTAYHSALDGKFGDGIAFGVSKVEQVHKTLDALEAGPLPADVADAITAIYATVEGSEPPYFLGEATTELVSTQEQ